MGFSFPIWADEKYKVPVCGRGVRLSLFWSRFVGEESGGFHKEFSSPTCLWVVQLNKHFTERGKTYVLSKTKAKQSPWAAAGLPSSPAKPRKDKPPGLGQVPNLLPLPELF